MDFSQRLYTLATEYEFRKLEEFGSNPFGKAIRTGLAAAAANIAGPPFIVKASVGQGGWTDVPWLAFFHPLETRSAQQGFYVVYLVNPVKQTISLSLIQGVTAAKIEAGTTQKTRELLKFRANLIADRAGKLPVGFSRTPIDLGTSGSLGRDYEASHTFGKTYAISDLKSSEEIETDLIDMLGIYKRLVTENGYTIPDDSEGEEFGTVIEKKKISLHKRFDRLGGAGSKVKELKGYACEACGFDFEKTYGELGKKFIEAHHLIPFADLDEDMSRTLDLKKDFAVLCSNCHSMIHRQKDPSDLNLLKKSINKG